MNEYVVKVYANPVCWCTGFIVDKYLITAGHLSKPDVKSYDFIYKERLIHLPKPHYFSHRDGRFDVPDLAIFSLKDIISPLFLSNRMVTENQILKSKCFQGEGTEKAFVECSVTVTDIDRDDNLYFAGTPEKKLFQSSSGSPVLINDTEVVGMLVAGPPTEEVHNMAQEKCLFLSSKTILDIISDNCPSA